MTRDFVRWLFEAIDARQWDRLAEFFHPEIEYQRPGYDSLVGLEAVVRFYREVRVLASGNHQVTAIAIDGTHGACWGRYLGSRRDGTPVDIEFADCYEFEDGKIRRRKSFFYVPLV